MHAPPWHVAGATHGGAPSHVQSPSAEQPFPSEPQPVQLPPLMPHSFGSFPGWQTPFTSQHPAHDVASQLHDPFEQCCPLRQAAPPLHVHCPAAHPSPRGSHPPHACPIEPHVPAATGAQVPASVQQLLGHDAASQMHAPFEHTCPCAHGADGPHWQAPAELQLSADAARQV
jgi:hypothetical protein